MSSLTKSYITKCCPSSNNMYLGFVSLTVLGCIIASFLYHTMVGVGLCVTLQSNATACPSLTVTLALSILPNPWKTK